MSAYTNAHSAARGAYPPADGREWVVLLTPDTRRMMSTLEVQAEVSAGTLARETLVWRAGMNEWLAIASIGELDVAPPYRAAPVVSWDAPAAPQYAHSGHAHVGHAHAGQAQARPHARAQRPASSAQLTQELLTTGAVAVIMVAMTLYMLSLGGAFAPGTGQHTAQGAQASVASAQKSH